MAPASSPPQSLPTVSEGPSIANPSETRSPEGFAVLQSSRHVLSSAFAYMSTVTIDSGLHEDSAGHTPTRHLLQSSASAPPAPSAPLPRDPRARPADAWPEPSHSCTAIMTGIGSPGVPPSAAGPLRLTLTCSGGVGLTVRLSPWLDSARNRSSSSSSNSIPDNLPGPDGSHASTPPEVSVQGLTISPEPLPGSSGTGNEDWRMVLVCGPEVAHLRLHSSVLADVPLSTKGPLLQLVSCGTLSLSAVTLARLSAPSGTSPDALPAYGAVHARGLRQGALLDGVECSGVAGTHTWACFLLSFAEQEQPGTGGLAPSPSPQQQAEQPLPSARVQIQNSRLTDNNVAANTSRPLNQSLLLPDVAAALSIGRGCLGGSYGAVVVSSASAPTAGMAVQRTAVVDVVVSNSTLSNNAGGCGGALAALCSLVSEFATGQRSVMYICNRHTCWWPGRPRIAAWLRSQ